MKGTLIFLGCGNSAGVPAIGNFWGHCDPAEPKNRRTRPSVVLRTAAGALVIDTGPDFKEQVNRTGLADFDAVLYTHTHSDHINGIDDLRLLSHRNKMQIPVYGAAETLDALQGRFSYLFAGSADGLYRPVLRPVPIMPEDLGKIVTIGGIPLLVFEQDHGTCVSLGVRAGTIGYSCDMVRLDDAALEVLKGVETWVVDSAGYKAEKTIVHASLAQIYEMNARIGAHRVVLTHMTPYMDYRTLCSELPDGYEPAHDGMQIEFTL